MAISGEIESPVGYDTRPVNFAMLFDGEQWVPLSDFERPDGQDLGKFTMSVTFEGRMFLYSKEKYNNSNSEKLILSKVFEIVVCGA